MSTNTTPSFSFNAVNTLNGLASYTENGAAVVLDSTVQIYDAELSAQGHYAGASITLTRHGGANSQDVFSPSGNLIFSGNDVVLSGVSIGTAGNSNGTLTITFNSNATQTRVNEALSSLAYSNTSDNPPASVQIDWIFSDGNSGVQGTGSELFVLGSSTVNITATNDAPTGTATAVLADGSEDMAYTLKASDLLLGFNDADGDSLSVTNLTATNGTLAAIAGGWTFTPNANYNGAAQLNYNVVDGKGGSITAVQSFNLAAVNDAPSFALIGNGIVITDTGSTEAAYSIALQADGKILVAGFNFCLIRYNSDGSLDIGFASNGVSTTNFGYYENEHNFSYYDEISAYSVTVQMDGKILLAGSYSRYTSDNSYLGVALARYNIDGTLDTSFGDDGKVTTDFGDGIYSSSGKSVTVQADGKILVVSSNGDFALLRYNSDGSLDTSFDGDGVVTTDFGSIDVSYFATVQTDGKIILAGGSWNSSSTNYDFALARYNSDGSLDTNFGVDGKITNTNGFYVENQQSVTVQTDGKILVPLGWNNSVSNHNDFILVRYNSDGSLDTGFDNDGIVVTDFGSYDWGFSVTVQADGKILVAGGSWNSSSTNYDFALARYNSDGSLDTSFDGDGKVTTVVGIDGAQSFSVTVQADGKILLAGYSDSDSGYNTNKDSALVRYNPNGSLDTSFNATNTLNATPSYTENDTPIILDADVNISDIELDAINNYNGASVTLARHGGANSQDVFAGLGILTFTNDAVILDTTTVGSYTQNNGQLIITFNANASSANVDSTLQQIAYSNTSDAPPSSVTIDWTFNDGNVEAQGIGGALTALGSTTVNITAVNDAPTGTATAELADGAEDNIYTINTTDLLLGFNDVDGDVLSVANLTAPHGVLSIVAEGWIFSANADFNGIVDLTYNVVDGHDSSVAGIQHFNLAPINDAPTLTAFSSAVASGNEDSICTVSFADLQAKGNEADVDGTVDSFAIKAVSSGSLKIGSSAGRATTWNAITNNTVDATHNAYWTPTANANGVLNAFTAVAKDNGGVESAIAIQAMVNVTVVNDAPTLTAFTSAITNSNEDSEVTVSLAALQAQGNEADVDGTVDSFVIKAISNGRLKIGATAGTATAWVADNNATIDATRNAYWTPDANANGTLNAFTVVAKDNGASESSPAIQATVSITAVNDAPTATSKTITFNEDNSYSFTATDFGYADIDGNALASIKITSLPGAGSLKLSGVAVILNQVIAAALIPNLSFTPTTNTNGAGYANFNFSVNDGSLSSVSTNIVTLNVTALNDVPTLTAFSSTVVGGNEDSICTVSFADLQAKGNEADVDGTVNSFTVNAVSSGNLKIGASAATAKAWNAITNNTVDATHTAYWTPAANANGTLNAFTVTVKDDNGAVSATPVQAQVSVTAVNDAPILSAVKTINYTDTVFDDSFATVTGKLVAGDIDGNALTYGIAGGIDNGDGTLSQTGVYGVLTLTKTTGAYSFAPNDAAIEALAVNANANFSVTASDGSLSNTKTLAINITQKGTTESIGNDTLTGTSANNKFDGLAGNDIINGLTGADTMTGGLGNDTYVVDNKGDVVIETSTLSSEIDSVNSSVNFILAANVENLSLTGIKAINGTGNALANTLIGNSAKNLLLGNAGNDALSGGDGNDILDGGTGNDLLTGGAGLDVFRFATAPTANVDTVADFNVADDTIQLENSIFNSLAKTGVLKAANFVTATAAADLNDYIVYNPATGALLYDADGNGAGAAQQIALLGVHLDLTPADFAII